MAARSTVAPGTDESGRDAANEASIPTADAHQNPGEPPKLGSRTKTRTHTTAASTVKAHQQANEKNQANLKAGRDLKRKQRKKNSRKSAEPYPAIVELLEKNGYILEESYRDNGAHLCCLQVPAEKGQTVGTAVSFSRISGPDKNDGATVLTQVTQSLLFSRSQGLNIGRIVISTDCSGARSYFDRPDFRMLARLIGEGRCTAIVWRETDRVTRSVQAYTMLWEKLKQNEIEFYLEDRNRKLDLTSFGDFLHTLINVAVAEDEIVKTLSRTSGGGKRRILAGTSG